MTTDDQHWVSVPRCHATSWATRLQNFHIIIKLQKADREALLFCFAPGTKTLERSPATAWLDLLHSRGAGGAKEKEEKEKEKEEEEEHRPDPLSRSWDGNMNLRLDKARLARHGRICHEPARGTTDKKSSCMNDNNFGRLRFFNLSVWCGFSCFCSTNECFNVISLYYVFVFVCICIMSICWDWFLEEVKMQKLMVYLIAPIGALCDPSLRWAIIEF